MGPVKLIISFDTEEYITPEADDAEKWWADALTRHGLTGCFCVVGEEARALRDRGRHDVIAAIARHETAFHSDLHSVHPTHSEYLDCLEWEDGLARVLVGQSPGLRDVADVFGQWPSADCMPGNSWGPQVPYGMSLLNVPFYCGSAFEAAPGQPLHYTGSTFLKYHIAFDHYFDAPDRLVRMQRDFGEILASREPGSVICLYAHPSRTWTDRFSDGDNFGQGRNPPRAEWRPAPVRPRDRIIELTSDFDAFLDWISSLVSAGRLEPTTYRAMTASLAPGRVRWLAAGELHTAAKLLAAPERITFRRIGDGWLTPSEQFGVMSWVLAHRSNGQLPSFVPVRDLLGPLDVPVETAGGFDASADAIAAAATSMLPDSRSIPSGVVVAGRTIGPAAYARAAASLIVNLMESGYSGAGVRVEPTPELPALADRADVAGLRFEGSWLYPPGFTGARVLASIRRQTWAAKPA